VIPPESILFYFHLTINRMRLSQKY